MCWDYNEHNACIMSYSIANSSQYIRGDNFSMVCQCLQNIHQIANKLHHIFTCSHHIGKEGY